MQQARASFRKFVLDHDLDVVEASRFMAMISVTYADALIACFDAKYHYAFWRPITAIRAGDTDGNEATVGDPGLVAAARGTPNHPEYPSAHSCITPAGGTRHRQVPGDTADRLHRPEPDRLGTALRTGRGSASTRSGNARIWGGIHYRSAVEDGVEIGKQTVHQVLAHHFQR